MNTNAGGARIRGQSPKPSIDLASLIGMLAKAIPAPSSPQDIRDSKQRPFLLWNDEKQRLKICTSAVLKRLFSLQDFKQTFDPDRAGFVRDLNMPGYGTEVKLGGHLAEGSEIDLPKNLDELTDAIDKELKRALPPGISLSNLLLDDVAQQMQAIAKAAGASVQSSANTANLVPISFSSSDNKTGEAVAKVISVIERVDTDDFFDRMCKAIRSHLDSEGYDEYEIGIAIDNLSAEKDRKDSQILRFINFLQDKALARVRLANGIEIMKAVGDLCCNSLLGEYIGRVIFLKDNAAEWGYSVDLSASYGINAEFNLSDYLTQASFYYSLPVWVDWQTQIFEDRKVSENHERYEVVRELTYRFRINGKVPGLEQSAFERRLDEIEAILLLNEADAPPSPNKINRAIAQLVFLAAVVPNSDEPDVDLDAQSLHSSVEDLLKQFAENGSSQIEKTLRDLRDRQQLMDKIAGELIAILKDKTQKIVSQAQQPASEQFICVKESIVEWTRLQGARSGLGNLLVGSSQVKKEEIEWFKHIEISPKPDAIALLFSVKVRTQLVQYNLVKNGAPANVQIQRLFDAPEGKETPRNRLLQIIWVPHESEKGANGQWFYKPTESALIFNRTDNWILPASIHVEYEIKTLARQKSKPSAGAAQYHCAAIAAFSTLIYACLQIIADRLQASEPHSNITALMLRLQSKGKESRSDDGDGDAYAYGAAQAIEALLGQSLPIKMQGVVVDSLVKSNAAKWIKQATYKALEAAFPIAIATPTKPSVSQIGLVSYAVRPVDESPDFAEDETGYLFRTQSYIATATERPFVGLQLSRERQQFDLIDSVEKLGQQRVVREEIAYLKERGCQHILLLSHLYGGRKTNRTSEGHFQLERRQFLEDLLDNFRDLTIYPMVRDVFPASRLRKRSFGEAGFEICRASHHGKFPDSNLKKLNGRDLIPVYTFATLNVVGEEDKRPQSGFCIYFLLSDSGVSDIEWVDKARLHLTNPEQQSAVHPCLIALLRGLHFIEAEKGADKGQLVPVLDPFSWIWPGNVESIGEVSVLHARRKGRVLLSYPALLTNISQAMHRR